MKCGSCDAATRLCAVVGGRSCVRHVVLLRHGEAAHNAAAGARGNAEYRSEEWADARLTERGREQARVVRREFESSGDSVDVVIVSPLSRALETAMIVFGDASVPLECHSTVRECCGQNPCDRRRPTAELRIEFPVVDMSSLTPTDEEWSPEREPMEALDARAREFVLTLARRREARIAVVSHNDFLQAVHRVFAGCGVVVDYDAYSVPIPNCSLRAADLLFAPV